MVKAPACPFSAKVNGNHIGTHTCKKPTSADPAQRRRLWPSDRTLGCECKCGADTAR